MINAGIAEYGTILTGMAGGTTFPSIEPTAKVIAIAAGIVFLFWLVVFKL